MPDADLPELDPAELSRHLDAICSFGNRYVGSAGERAAREYVLAQLKLAGLSDVRAEPLQVRTYACEDAACRVPAPNLDLECTGFPATAPGEIEAEAVYVGGGTDFDELLTDETQLNGKIAVFGSYWPWELTDALVAQGIAGMVLISEVPEDGIAHLPARWYGSLNELDGHHPASVPGIIVGANTGRRLVAAIAGKPTKVQLTHRASYPTHTTANLLAELPGGNSQETVVLAAHYDTFGAGVGAHDNATGLASLLTAASAWAKHRPPKRTIRFASFAAEELGLVGATEYCRRHRADLDGTAAIVNLDALAWRVHSPRCLVVTDDLNKFATAQLTKRGWPPDTVRDATNAASDIAPFVEAGVPAAWCWRFPPQHAYFGSDGDSLEFIDRGLVADTAAAACGLAYAIADADAGSLPAR